MKEAADVLMQQRGSLRRVGQKETRNGMEASSPIRSSCRFSAACWTLVQALASSPIE
jgi:hypothetical protein